MVVILMTPSMLQNLFRLPPLDVQLANLVGTTALCLSTVEVGTATDRFGVRRVAILGLLAVLIVPGIHRLEDFSKEEMD